MRFGGWLQRLRQARTARKLLAAAFRSPERLRGTSLEPRHAGRWVLLEYELAGSEVAAVRFGILRHPRPYPFSRQSHKVIEVYRYDVAAGRMERLEGRNLTRGRGEDAD